MTSHTAINFHYVGMPQLPHPGIHGLDDAAFRQRIEDIGRGHEFIGLSDIHAALRGERSFPERACLITFDDGLRCQFEHALPILDAFEVPAVFFVVADPVVVRRATAIHKLHWARAMLGDAAMLAAIAEEHAEGRFPHAPSHVDSVAARESYRYDTLEAACMKYFLSYVLPADLADRVVTSVLDQAGWDESAFVAEMYMTPEMVRTLAQREMLGSHTASHRPLAQLVSAEAERELVASKRALEDIAGSPVTALSYPLGNARAVSRSVADAAARAGYTVAWTMERARNETLEDPLLFARVDANESASVDMLAPRERYYHEERVAVVTRTA